MDPLAAIDEAGVTSPAARELADLVMRTRGRIPRIRRALVALRAPTLAWVVPPIPTGEARHVGGHRSFDLVVLTGAPRSLVRVQLVDLTGRDRRIHCMSIREWVARSDEGDVDVRRIRRARKLWILGSWADLVSRERAVIASRRTLQTALSSWQEELSDERPEGWDPFDPSLTPVG